MMKYRAFIEEAPLFQASELTDVSNTPPPTVDLNCDQCSRHQPHHTAQYLQGTAGFGMVLTGGSRLRRNSPQPLGESVQRLALEGGGEDVSLNQGTALLFYYCAGCKRELAIGVHYDGPKFTKFGQWPSSRPSVPVELRGFLKDERADLYKKAMTSYENGFGIGSAAYFRRLMETLIDDLLDEVENHLFHEPEAKARFEAALTQVRGSHRAADKIQVIKDLVPPVLRPGNIDPIGRLYKALSVDIHHSTDAEALALADTIRAALTFVIRKIYESKRDAEDYAKALRKLEE